MTTKVTDIVGTEHRKLENSVNPLFLNRWSPRAMSGEELPESDLLTLLEAARWAPSCFNLQPWRFLYARQGTENWDTFLNLMVEFNQTWAGKAGALLVVISKKTFDHNGKPADTHSFDTGAATQNLALQGMLMGLVVHSMAGFDYDKAREVLEIPEDFTVEAMMAVGLPGNVEDLPEEMQEREVPSPRKELQEIAFNGKFKS